jgi:hypothetical protein
MKKLSTKTSLRSKGSGRKAKGERGVELDRGWNELEAQADRLKTDWMSLSVQLGIGGHSDKSSFE